MEDLGIRKELHLLSNSDTYDIPNSCYTLTKDKSILLCKFLRDDKFPYGYAGNLERCVNMDGCKVQGLTWMAIPSILLCKFLRDDKFPYGYAGNLARCVNMDGCKVQGLKTHDSHILLQ